MTSDPSLRRRDALTKVAAGAAVAGVAWTAPRVSGLSLRPDHAAAQSGPGDVVDTGPPGVTLDLTLGSTASSNVIAVSDAAVLPSGLVAAATGRTSGASGSYPVGIYFQTQQASGVGAAIDCFVSFDVFGNAILAPLSANGFDAPGSVTIRQQTYTVNVAGNIGTTAHIVCT